MKKKNPIDLLKNLYKEKEKNFLKSLKERKERKEFLGEKKYIGKFEFYNNIEPLDERERTLWDQGYLEGIKEGIYYLNNNIFK